eukprot:PhM_4_TR5728/c2_g1_i1/m.90500
MSINIEKITRRAKTIFDPTQKVQTRFRSLCTLRDDGFSSAELSELYRSNHKAVLTLYLEHVKAMDVQCQTRMRPLQVSDVQPIYTVMRHMLVFLKEYIRKQWETPTFNEEIYCFLLAENDHSVRRWGVELLMLLVEAEQQHDGAAIDATRASALLSMFDWSNVFGGDVSHLPTSISEIRKWRHYCFPTTEPNDGPGSTGQANTPRLQLLQQQQPQQQTPVVGDLLKVVFDYILSTDGPRLSLWWGFLKMYLLPLLFVSLYRKQSFPSAFPDLEAPTSTAKLSRRVQAMTAVFFVSCFIKPTLNAVVCESREDALLIRAILADTYNVASAAECKVLYQLNRVVLGWVRDVNGTGDGKLCVPRGVASLGINEFVCDIVQAACALGALVDCDPKATIPCTQQQGGATDLLIELQTAAVESLMEVCVEVVLSKDSLRSETRHHAFAAIMTVFRSVHAGATPIVCRWCSAATTAALYQTILILSLENGNESEIASAYDAIVGAILSPREERLPVIPSGATYNLATQSAAATSGFLCPHYPLRHWKVVAHYLLHAIDAHAPSAASTGVLELQMHGAYDGPVQRGGFLDSARGKRKDKTRFARLSFSQQTTAENNPLLETIFCHHVKCLHGVVTEEAVRTTLAPQILAEVVASLGSVMHTAATKPFISQNIAVALFGVPLLAVAQHAPEATDARYESTCVAICLLCDVLSVHSFDLEMASPCFVRSLLPPIMRSLSADHQQSEILLTHLATLLEVLDDATFSNSEDFISSLHGAVLLVLESGPHLPEPTVVAAMRSTAWLCAQACTPGQSERAFHVYAMCKVALRVEPHVHVMTLATNILLRLIVHELSVETPHAGFVYQCIEDVLCALSNRHDAVAYAALETVFALSQHMPQLMAIDPRLGPLMHAALCTHILFVLHEPHVESSPTLLFALHVAEVLTSHTPQFDTMMLSDNSADDALVHDLVIDTFGYISTSRCMHQWYSLQKERRGTPSKPTVVRVVGSQVVTAAMRQGLCVPARLDDESPTKSTPLWWDDESSNTNIKRKTTYLRETASVILSRMIVCHDKAGPDPTDSALSFLNKDLCSTTPPETTSNNQPSVTLVVNDHHLLSASSATKGTGHCHLIARTPNGRFSWDVETLHKESNAADEQQRFRDASVSKASPLPGMPLTQSVAEKTNNILETMFNACDVPWFTPESMPLKTVHQLKRKEPTPCLASETGNDTPSSSAAGAFPTSLYASLGLFNIGTAPGARKINTTKPPVPRSVASLDDAFLVGPQRAILDAMPTRREVLIGLLGFSGFKSPFVSDFLRGLARSTSDGGNGSKEQEDDLILTDATTVTRFIMLESLSADERVDMCTRGKLACVVSWEGATMSSREFTNNNNNNNNASCHCIAVRVRHTMPSLLQIVSHGPTKTTFLCSSNTAGIVVATMCKSLPWRSLSFASPKDASQAHNQHPSYVRLAAMTNATQKTVDTRTAYADYFVPLIHTTVL